MKAIEIKNVNKTFRTTKRKLWFQHINDEDNPESNVRINQSNHRLYKKSVKYTQALKNISLSVEKGEILGLLGPNGAGKTTLAKIVSTLVLPDSGSVTVNGFDVEKQTVLARFSLGLVTGGERSLYWKLSPMQNLMFFGGLYGLTKTEARGRAAYYIELFGLKDKKHELIQNLSTGQKMKVAFIRALMHDPEVMILDEYNRGLDPKASKELRDYIRNVLQKEHEKTILVMTHSMDVAQDLCQRIVLVDRGEIVAKGTPAELKSGLSKTKIVEMESTIAFGDKAIEELSQLGKIEITNGSIFNARLIVSNDPHKTYEVLQIIEANGIKLKNLNLKEPNLEDVFIQYTGRTLEDD